MRIVEYKGASVHTYTCTTLSNTSVTGGAGQPPKLVILVKDATTVSQGSPMKPTSEPHQNLACDLINKSLKYVNYHVLSTVLHR